MITSFIYKHKHELNNRLSYIIFYSGIIKLFFSIFLFCKVKYLNGIYNNSRYLNELIYAQFSFGLIYNTHVAMYIHI